MSNVRVRFAPSPTGGLHLGGVRTVLFNYLYAKKYDGKFIVRIEDTDQSRYVDTAEAYIFECLHWCGIQADESVINPGPFAPYRQSERKEIYQQYADKLISDGYAYYAFDTPDEIAAMREKRKADGNGSLQYDAGIRLHMNNSLRLMPAETDAWLSSGKPYVVRLKVPDNETVRFVDMIRGELQFDTANVDDKVLIKADGMPTYHLAVVVDDYLMQISHAFRGEEWLPSAPVHVLLWAYLFGVDKMPQWAHLPLILKPDGHGKLSKRDGDRLGFPVYAMDWVDPATSHVTKGFKELGFLPEAFINMLALLGWNPGSEQEIFSMEELVQLFSIARVSHAGAKFDYEKAKWFNQQWIQKLPISQYQPRVKNILQVSGIAVDDEQYLNKVIALVRERCTLLTDFVQQAGYFFEAPTNWDVAAVMPKWNTEKHVFFEELIQHIIALEDYSASTLELIFKNLATMHNIKPGELQLPMRIMLVGAKYGPGVFDIASTIGKQNTIGRIEMALQIFIKNGGS